MQGAGLALYNPLTDNWGELVLVAGHPAPKPGEQAGASWDRVSANYLQNLGVTLVRGRHFTAADNETTEHVAVVNEAFVRRFFKSDEDPLDQHFGLDLPENVDTYRIVGIVRDAKFAGFALDRPARPMFYVPLAQTVDYAEPADEAARIERRTSSAGCCSSRTCRPARSSRWSKRALAERRSEPDHHQRADAAAAGAIGRSISSAPSPAWPDCSASSRWCSRRSVSTASPPTRSRSARTRSASGWRSAPIAATCSGWCCTARSAASLLGLVLGLPLAIGAGHLLSAQLYGVSFWDPLALAVGALSLARVRVDRRGHSGAARRVDLAHPRAAHGVSPGHRAIIRP